VSWISSQRTTFTLSSCSSRLAALPKLPTAPVHSVGPAQNFHSTPA
jgi:hypothetical protein